MLEGPPYLAPSPCLDSLTEPVKLSEFCRDMAFATEATPGSSRDDRLFYKDIKRVGLRIEDFQQGTSINPASVIIVSSIWATPWSDIEFLTTKSRLHYRSLIQKNLCSKFKYKQIHEVNSCCRKERGQKSTPHKMLLRVSGFLVR
jgi:hypothetical protein